MEKIIGTVPGKCRKKREKARLTLNNNPEISWHMKKSRRTYNGVHLNKKSNTQDVVEQSLTEYHHIDISVDKAICYLKEHDEELFAVFQPFFIELQRFCAEYQHNYKSQF